VESYLSRTRDVAAAKAFFRKALKHHGEPRSITLDAFSRVTRHCAGYTELLSRVFRGKFVAGLKRAFQRKKLTFHGACLPLSNDKVFAGFLRTLFREDWVVYSKAPFGGPEHVLQYLARYTHRVAISNHRIVHVSDTHVEFRWKDYAHHHKRRTMTLTHEEFLRRFLQHVLPKGFPCIRYFGFLANRRRGELLSLCRTYANQFPIGSRRPHRPLPPVNLLSGAALAAKERCVSWND
jgi:hypothetical protein